MQFNSTVAAKGRLALFCGGLAMIFSGLAGAQVAISAPSAGLAEYLPFNETSGTIAHDVSGNNNNGGLRCNGTCTPLPAWTGGVRDGALNFTSPNDLVSIPDSASLEVTNQFTFAFWAKVSTGAANIVYLQKATGSMVGQGSSPTNGYLIATGTPGNYVYINIYNNNARTARCSSTTTGVIQSQAWQHYAFTYDGASIKIFVNGALNEECSARGAAGKDATPLSIGRRRESRQRDRRNG